MLRFCAVVLAVVCAAGAYAQTCPFNIPVVTIPPHSAGGFTWGNPIRPMGDACITHFAIDTSTNIAWYAGGANGLYMTKNSGQTWTKPLSGNVGALFLVKEQPNVVYVAIANRLYLTRDSGSTWMLIRTFPVTIASLLVANNTLYVGPHGSDNPSGIWVCSMGGSTAVFKPFGAAYTGVIVWSMARDPISGTLYAGGEIYNHPSPYDPPYFRSSDNGNTWTEISGTLPWHVVASAVRPSDGYLYVLLEGPGVWGSPNQGNSWLPPTNSHGLGVSLLVDPKTPTRLFAGRQNYGTLTGGLWMSTNAGLSFTSIGLSGATIADIDLNSYGQRIYATAYGSGIYVSPVP